MAMETQANDEQRAKLAAHLIDAMKHGPMVPLAPVLRGEGSGVRGSSSRDVLPLTPALSPGVPRERVGNRQRFIFFAPELVRAILDGRKTLTRRLAKNPHNPCPFGLPGDSLWVREKWGYLDEFFDRRKRRSGPFVYASDGPPPGAKRIAWRPSLHMPRQACRVILHITSTRVERLDQITRDDALAEGCPDDRRDDPIGWLRQLWDGLSPDRQKSWQGNPWVWVICFDVKILSPT
jgi:hypothetical protein